MGSAAAGQLQDGRFLLLETLGRGGMASVYRAFDSVTQRVVALKVQLDREPAGPAHAFAAEFEAWSRLSHPNVVGAFELLTSRTGPLPGAAPYLVLEHVRGGPAHRVLRPGREPPATWERFARSVLQGLAHVHGAGYLHRDIKPSNILVGPRGGNRPSVKLTDFGLVTRVGTRDEPGCVSGSLPYLSPEALAGKELDERADLYGLGILMYQLSTGALPLARATPDDWVRWHLSGPPLSVASAGCSRRMTRFIRRLTARRREERPLDAAAAASLLGGVTEPRRSGPIPCSASERARVRLAVDAVRLGAVRLYHVGEARPKAAAVTEEARIAAQILGIDWYALGPQPTGGGDVETLALALLSRHGDDPRRVLSKYELERTLDLEILGTHPVVTRAQRVPRVESVHDGPRLARWLLDSARRRASALAVSRAARERDPRVAALCRELQRAADSRDRPQRGSGGLLVLLP